MTTTLYDTDFTKWALQQADVLRRAEDIADLDVENLIEEIEDMARRDREKFEGRLTSLLLHMLKLTCEPESQAVNHWKHEITAERIKLKRLLKHNATLRATIDDYIGEAYQDSLLLAQGKTRCEVNDFSPHCPWTGEELLDINFWPDPLP